MRNKESAYKEVGLTYIKHELPEEATQEEVGLSEGKEEAGMGRGKEVSWTRI